MFRAISWAKGLLVAGAMTFSLIGFAGVASAAHSAQDPVTCWGSIPAGSAHQPFSHGPAQGEGCGTNDDTSKTSMADMASAGSYKGNNPAFAYSPETKAHKAA